MIPPMVAVVMAVVMAVVVRVVVAVAVAVVLRVVAGAVVVGVAVAVAVVMAFAVVLLAAMAMTVLVAVLVVVVTMLAVVVTSSSTAAPIGGRHGGLQAARAAVQLRGPGPGAGVGKEGELHLTGHTAFKYGTRCASDTHDGTQVAAEGVAGRRGEVRGPGSGVPQGAGCGGPPTQGHQHMQAGGTRPCCSAAPNSTSLKPTPHCRTAKVAAGHTVRIRDPQHTEHPAYRYPLQALHHTAVSTSTLVLYTGAHAPPRPPPSPPSPATAPPRRAAPGPPPGTTATRGQSRTGTRTPDGRGARAAWWPARGGRHVVMTR